jgi:hypothetical protein
MSIWTRIATALASLGLGDSLASLFERLKAPPERSVAFTIAVIALGAKMAKADGTVTRDEVSAFREVFTIPEGGRPAPPGSSIWRARTWPGSRITRSGSARCSTAIPKCSAT